MRKSAALWIGALATMLVAAPITWAMASDIPVMDADIHRLEQSWAHIKYEVTDSNDQLKQLEALAKDAAATVERHPGRAEPLVWEGVITSTEAGLAGPISAMGYAKAARTMFPKGNRRISTAP